MDKQAIIDASKKRREGERIFYTSCPANGCWDSACVLRCHEKDGKIIAIERTIPSTKTTAARIAAGRTSGRATSRCAPARWVMPGSRNSTPRRDFFTR